MSGTVGAVVSSHALRPTTPAMAYTYVVLEIAPDALVVDGNVWVSCESLHVTLAYLPLVDELERQRVAADLNDTVRRYFTLTPGERVSQPFKGPRFYQVERRGTEIAVEDAKANICGMGWAR